MPGQCWNTPGRGNHRIGVIALGHYPVATTRVCGVVAKHAAFALVILLFNLYLGQNWAHFSSALMVAAWVRYKGDLTARL